MALTPDSLLQHADTATLWPASERDPTAWSDLAAAYQAALAVRALRVARGERPIGYKIGFTNRTIWERYGVYAPIWGPVWDHTVRQCEDSGELDLRGTSQPRLEPEIVFGIRATPPAAPTLETLFECVEWLAPGFEIVHTHCADWKFSAPETVADAALHGRLLVGRRTPVRALASSGAALDALLASSRVQLLHDDRVMDEGRGSNVLDGPLHALLHFVQAMQQCPGAPVLLPGELVTTGTWTDAWPVQPGQRWRSQFDAPLHSLAVQFR